MGKILLAMLAAAAFSGAAHASNPIIPDVFHGVWQSTEPQAVPTCAPIDSDMRMIVGAQRVDFHESICLPQSVAAGDGATRIDSACEGEGFEWTTSHEWMLSEAGGHQFLHIANLDPDEPFEAVYGRCPAEAGWETGAASPAPASQEATCYRRDLSEMELQVLADGTAQMSVLSAQGNAHICSLEAGMTPVENGYRYSETLDDGALCELTMTVAADGAIGFEDPDWTCKQYYCGARAAFEFIEFAAADIVACN